MNAVPQAFAAATKTLLSLANSQPDLLRDVLRLKRLRGDADADQFKAVACADFAVKLNATVGGAQWGMRQWLAKGALRSTPERVAFLADLDSVRAPSTAKAITLEEEDV